MEGGKHLKEALREVYIESIKSVFVTQPKRDKWLKTSQDDIAKDWIGDLMQENEKLKENNERLLKEIRGLNSSLGRTLWNPQG